MKIKFNKFARLTKVDEAQRLVWGTIAKQDPDKANEIMDYAKSKPHFEAWSGDIAKATNGASLGNVRIMHKAEIGGKLVDISYHDDDQRIDVCAKVLDDKAWELVKEGALTGFSIGGSYISKTEVGELTYYVAKPAEVSLVDNPCLKAAHFTMVKADGTEADVALPVFSPDNISILAEADLISKAEGASGVIADYIDAARESLFLKASEAAMKTDMEDDSEEDPEDEESPAKEAAEAKDESKEADKAMDKAVDSEDLGVRQVWEVGGKTFLKKADALAHLGRISNPILKAVEDAGEAVTADVAKTGEVLVADIVNPELGKAYDLLKEVQEKASGTGLFKSIYSVSRLSEIIDSLRYLVDCQCWDTAKGTGPTANAVALAECLKDLSGALVVMASEETQRMLADMTSCYPTVFTTEVYSDMAEKAAGAFGADTLAKIGARNSGVDQGRLDTIVALAQELGATCTTEAEKADGGELAKVIEERDLLKAQIQDSVPEVVKIASELQELRKTVKRLEDQPVPMPGTSLVSKGGAEPATAESLAEMLNKLTPEEKKDVLFKAALQVPVPIGR